MRRFALTPLAHAMINTGAIVTEFCTILALSTLFPGIANCAPSPGVGTALTLEDGVTALTLEDGATALVLGDA